MAMPTVVRKIANPNRLAAGSTLLKFADLPADERLFVRIAASHDQRCPRRLFDARILDRVIRLVIVDPFVELRGDDLDIVGRHEQFLGGESVFQGIGT